MHVPAHDEDTISRRGFRKLNRLLPWALTTIVAFGCVSPSETEIMLQLGYVVDDSDFLEPLLTIEPLSDQVHVEVTTLGNSCISKGRMAVAKDGAHVLLMPYDYVRIGTACVRGVGGEHETTVRFDVPRPWTIELRGLRQGIDRDTVTFTRVIE